MGHVQKDGDLRVIIGAGSYELKVGPDGSFVLTGSRLVGIERVDIGDGSRLGGGGGNGRYGFEVVEAGGNGGAGRKLGSLARLLRP